MLFDLYCLQHVNCLTFLENLETDSGTCRMIASDLWRMMEVDVDVSLKTCLCISGEVLHFLYHFFFHGKLVTRASLWDTSHMIFAYTQNLFDTFHHGVFLFLVRLLQINTEGNNPCFSVPEICLWEPFLQISGKQSTAQFLFFLVHLSQYAPQPPQFSYMSYQ